MIALFKGSLIEHLVPSLVGHQLLPPYPLTPSGPPTGTGSGGRSEGVLGCAGRLPRPVGRHAHRVRAHL